jgi:nicotinamide riboside transporter PnuC
VARCVGEVTLAGAVWIRHDEGMRKILSIGLAASLVGAAAVVASSSESASSLAWQVFAGVARRSPVDLARDYGVMLLVLVMPTAVLGWGAWREARQRARTEV